MPFGVIVCVVFTRDFWRWWRADFPPLPDRTLDKYFETFKHLSTLSVATAAFVLAVSDKSSEEIEGIKAAVILLAVSLLAAIGGIHAVLVGGGLKRQLEVLYFTSAVLLGAGLMLFVVQYLGEG